MLFIEALLDRNGMWFEWERSGAKVGKGERNDQWDSKGDIGEGAGERERLRVIQKTWADCKAPLDWRKDG